MMHDRSNSAPSSDRQNFLADLEAVRLDAAWLAEAEDRKGEVTLAEREQGLLEAKAGRRVMAHQRPRAAMARRGWWLSATGLVGVIAAAAWFAGSSARHTSSSLQVSQFTTETGERRTVTLPDGSSIILAPQSRLTLHDGFGAQARSVALEGEAMFTVTQHASLPFIVHTGTVATTVLGTEFVARKYPADRVAQVAVIEGKVSFGTRRQSVTLTAGMIGQADDSIATAATSVLETDRLRAWTEGQIVFVSTPVREVLASLGRWYGYEFKVVDTTTSAQRVTATFNVASPMETLSELKRLLGVTMNVSGRIIVLRPDSAPREPSRRTVPTRRDLLEQSSTIHSGVGR